MLDSAAETVRNSHTCHANGTFLRLSSRMTTKAVRDLLPGPVNVLRRRFRRFNLDAPTPRAMVVVKAMDLRGRRVADAILNTKRVIVWTDIRASYRKRQAVSRKTRMKETLGRVVTCRSCSCHGPRRGGCFRRS